MGLLIKALEYNNFMRQDQILCNNTGPHEGFFVKILFMLKNYASYFNLKIQY